MSWLVLGGRCRRCQSPISVQYPLVELATALLWAWMGWRYGPTAEAVRNAVFATLLLGIAMTDARDFIIPHELTFRGVAVGLGLAFRVVPRGAIEMFAFLQHIEEFERRHNDLDPDIQ